jgi:hypothetical protein
LRALFLLLLLANLLFFAWSHWISPPPAPAGHATPSATGNGGIRLLREAPLGRELASETARPDAVAARPIVGCVSAGPFADRAAAEQASARLQRLGFGSRLRQDRGELPVGIWVRIEGFATPADAENALPGLRWAGVADAYVLDEDNGGATISLGIFGGAAGAAQAEKIARDAGFQPTSSEKTRESDVFWLDVDRQANGGLPTPEDVTGPRPGGPESIELRACPQSGTESATRGADA